MSKSLLIIIPCFNEGKTVKKLIKDIKSLNKDFDTLVVDDSSTDDTYSESSDVSSTVRLIKNLGIGGAVQTGFKYAIEKKYHFALQIDGDGQHIPSQIPLLLKAQEKTNADIVIGSRYIGNSVFKSTFLRRAGSSLIKYTLKIFYPKLTITDPTSGMRLMNKKAIELYAKNYRHDYPEPISIMLGLQSGLKIIEVGVKMERRIFGKSSISSLESIKYIIKVLGYLLICGFHGVVSKRRR